MESTGQPGRIHISKATADLLEKAGKGDWVEGRTDRVHVKGKGQMKTYWLKTIASTSSGGSSSENSGSADEPEEILEEQLQMKTTRLTRWAVEIMQKVLIDVERRRISISSHAHSTTETAALSEPTLKNDRTILDEVKEIIHLPHFQSANSFVPTTGNDVLNEKVRDQLQAYTHAISSMYNQNAFHNFENALRVMSSTVKLLNRIRAPEIETEGDSDAILHDSTFGITSDPLVQFACIFSALIHDGKCPHYAPKRVVIIRYFLTKFRKQWTIKGCPTQDSSLKSPHWQARTRIEVWPSKYLWILHGSSCKTRPLTP